MLRRRRKRRLLFYSVVASVLLAIALYVFGLALVQSLVYQHYHFAELIIPRLIDVTVFLWLFWVGSSVGSFLNVVAWRMPRGESINGRSYCPRCNTRLAARDNFPVFGWLALGGRCRTCRLPISARYPIVESIVGACVTAVGLAELYRLSLPLNGSAGFHGPIWSPNVSQQQIVLLVFHIVAICTSFACGLIRYDEQPLPSRLKIFAILVTILPILAFPWLQIVPWQLTWPIDVDPTNAFITAEDFFRRQSLIADPMSDRVSAVVRILCSLFCAAFFARVLSPGLCPTADAKLDPLGGGTIKMLDIVLILCIPSIIVGWQAFSAVLCIAAILARVAGATILANRTALSRFSVTIPIVLAFQLAMWRTLHQSPVWPSIDSPPWLILSWAAVALTIPLWLRDKPYAPGLEADGISETAESEGGPEAGEISP